MTFALKFACLMNNSVLLASDKILGLVYLLVTNTKPVELSKVNCCYFKDTNYF